MPSQQMVHMALYALWTCLSSVQATTGHTSLLSGSREESPTIAYLLLAGLAVVALSVVRRGWGRARASESSILGLPLRAPEKVQQASGFSSPRSTTPISVASSTSDTSERLPRTESRAERRRLWYAKNYKQKRLKVEKRRQQEVDGIHQGTLGVSVPDQRPAYTGRHILRNNTSAASAQFTQWTRAFRLYPRPVAPTSFEQHASVAPLPPPYTQADPRRSQSRGHLRTWPQTAHQYWQPQAPQYYRQHAQGSYGGVEAYNPSAHPRIVSVLRRDGYDAAQPYPPSYDRRMNATGQAFEGQYGGARAPTQRWLNDLERNSYDTVASDEYGASVAHQTTIRERPVADLSWVDRDYWSQPPPRGIPRAQTFPAKSEENMPQCHTP